MSLDTQMRNDFEDSAYRSGYAQGIEDAAKVAEGMFAGSAGELMTELISKRIRALLEGKTKTQIQKSQPDRLQVPSSSILGAYPHQHDHR